MTEEADINWCQILSFNYGFGKIINVVLEKQLKMPKVDQEDLGIS